MQVSRFHHKIVFTGGLSPPRPPALPGGLPASQTSWRGACSPLLNFWEALPLKLSFFLVPRSWHQDLGTQILVPRSWYQYQELGTKILVPRSWYQDLGTKILIPRSWYNKKTESLRGGASQTLSMQAPRQGVWGAGSPPGTAGGLGGRQPPSKNNFMVKR